MRIVAVVGLCTTLLAACAEDVRSPAEQDADDERAIAEVMAAQTPPPDVVTPQRITPEDRVRFGLGDTGCSFAVDDPERGALAILQMNVGYMKFDGVMERFAADAGSADGPAGTSTRYNGSSHQISVEFESLAAEKAAQEMLRLPTEITLRDGRDRTVYVAEGSALCG